METTRADLGRRIRIARESRDLTQEQLGALVGLSRGALGQIEAGVRSVSSLELDRIACAVGREIKSFFAPSFAERDALSALFRSEDRLAPQTDLPNALQESLALARNGQSRASAQDRPGSALHRDLRVAAGEIALGGDSAEAERGGR